MNKFVGIHKLLFYVIMFNSIDKYSIFVNNQKIIFLNYNKANLILFHFILIFFSLQFKFKYKNIEIDFALKIHCKVKYNILLVFLTKTCLKKYIDI